jgi:iron complex outermembrane receptor protein
MKKNLLLCVIMAVIISKSGFSQQNKSILKDTISIDEVVITGSKTSVNRNNVPLTVSVVSKEKIENSSESALLPVLSEQVPSLFVTERGITGFGVSTGSAGQIMLRGIGGSPNTEVLVLVDGNPQFMGVMGHPLPDTYIASDVEKVEVIHGAASTLYGTNAMGGVINIITKEQKEDGFSANGRLMYGSYNTQKYMANRFI